MICGSNGAGRRLNAFALVSYIPDPLAQFLDNLRLELVPACLPHAHVTILPPRPISTEPAFAASHARALIQDFPPFDVEAGDVNIFPATEVVYLEIGRGREELLRLHEALNAGPLVFKEPFDYHPHITLAQDVPPDEVEEVLGRARQAWAATRHARRFTLDMATFVQNALADVWIDLEEFRLGAVTPVR
jgi:2'-5' RNA ligase